nr:Ger(x)C family spore germination protein [Clostridium sp. 'deep sea']
MLGGCHGRAAIEDLAVVFGFGYDIDKIASPQPEYISVIEFISIQSEEEPGSDFYVGKGNTLYQSIENYKVKQGKPFGYGSELIYLISEDRAKFGIDDIILDLFRSFNVNIHASVAVVKGSCEEYFNLKSKTESASELLSNLIQYASDEYFYSSNNTVNDLIFKHFQQGRQICLPYIEIINEIPELSGIAVFNEDKMIKKLDIEETKLINILSTTGSKGIVSIESNDAHDYLEIEAKSKRKVKVTKADNKLNYDIQIKVVGTLVMDTLLQEELDKEQVSKIEKILAADLQKDLEQEIIKVQKIHKQDLLDVSKYAIAKYGADSKLDSTTNFINSQITVDVKVKIESIGRIYGNTKTK